MTSVNLASDGSVHTHRVGVLVHGCHLQANQWERIVWGEAPLLLGRFPKAVLTAFEEKADVVIFGTGASQLNGVKEGLYTLQYGIKRWKDIRSFDAFADFSDDKLQEIYERFKHISISELSSQNTIQEVTNALCIGQSFSITKLIQVSSPTHISRCIRDCLKAVQQAQFSDTCISAIDMASHDGQVVELKDGVQYIQHGSAKSVEMSSESDQKMSTKLCFPKIFATASDTCYANCTINDVVIVEPPHRGDRYDCDVTIATTISTR
jgi:hypothetical protein